MRDRETSIQRRRLLIGGAGAALLAGTACRALAQSWPARPIVFICPWSAGGTADLTMRALVSAASKSLGATMVLENRAGAAGMLGATALATAKPDGYTVGQVPLSVTRFTHLGNLRFDPLKDLTYIARTNGQTFGFACLPESRFKSLADLVAFAKANPGKVTCATSGAGGETHVGMMEFASNAGIDINHIPYKGGADALQAVLGGHVDFLSDSSSWAPHVVQGKLRLLATWGEERVPRFKDTPTLKELGYKVVRMAPNGVGAPSGIDPQILAKLRDAFKKAALSEEFKAACDKIDSVVMYLDADAYRKFVEENYAREKIQVEKFGLKQLLS
ncbi:MAG: tripartite tricarboxylate transporter substrate binding protein [Proteobacteria bacterium]|nr:tripartite tricarboxylate transporter substrate binding protein [Pseudomonadota bacterium]